MKKPFKTLLCSTFFLANFSDTVMAHKLPEPYASVELIEENPFGWYANRSQIEFIFSHHNIKTVIEVGSWVGGGSTRHMGEMLKKRGGTLYAVDTWLGSIEHQPGQSAYQPILPRLYQQFLSNMIHWNLTSVVVPMKMKSIEAAEILEVKPDLIYIDGDHTYNAVYTDLHAWYPHVHQDCVFCGDDWTWESVRAAVKKFAKEKGLKIQASGNFWRLI